MTNTQHHHVTSVLLRAAIVASGVALLGACGDDDSQTTIAKGTASVFGRSVELTATRDGDEVSGTAEVTAEGEPSFTLSFQCLDEPADHIVILAGEISKSEDEERPEGMRAAVLLNDGNPVGMGMWFEDPPPADACREFIANIPDDAVSDPASYVPADDIIMG
jgi:hypothetical protein